MSSTIGWLFLSIFFVVLRKEGLSDLYMKIELEREKQVKASARYRNQVLTANLNLLVFLKILECDLLHKVESFSVSFHFQQQRILLPHLIL